MQGAAADSKPKQPCTAQQEEFSMGAADDPQQINAGAAHSPMHAVDSPQLPLMTLPELKRVGTEGVNLGQVLQFPLT